MKKSKNVKITYVCPVCGNDIPYPLVFNRNIKKIICAFCKEDFPKWEIIKEKEMRK